MNRNVSIFKGLLRTRSLLSALSLWLVLSLMFPLQAQLSFYSPFDPLPAEPLVLVVPTTGNPITITNDGDPTKGDCGEYFWRVKFTLSAPSVAGGWIVQEYKRTPKIDDCSDNPVDHNVLHYWEAWRIDPGSTIDSARANGSYTFDDQYSEGPHPNTKGSIKIEGKVQFFEGAVLPPNFIPNNPNTWAGGLPSDTLPPPFFNTNEAINHNLCVNWDCCDGDTNDTMVVVYGDTTITYTDDDPPVITVTPDPDTTDSTVDVTDPVKIDDSGKVRKGKVRDTDPKNPYGTKTSPRMATDESLEANDPLVRLIRLLPAWNQALEMVNEAEFMEVAAELSKVPNNQLREAIHQHWALYRNSESNLEELSKTYVLMRVLFELPEAYTRNDARNFGGWVHPGALTKGEYNLSWPIAKSEEGTLTIEGEFAGFFGRGYNAPGEFDYFAARFPRRDVSAIATEQSTLTGPAFTLQPNPAVDYAELLSKEPLNQTVTINVINQFGRQLSTEKVDFDQAYRLDVNRLEEGLYFVIITTEDQQQSVKTLLIQR